MSRNAPERRSATFSNAVCGRGFVPDPTPLGELTALPRPLAVFRGPLRGRGREGERRWRKGGKEGKGRGGEGRGEERSSLLFTVKPLYEDL